MSGPTSIPNITRFKLAEISLFAQITPKQMKYVLPTPVFADKVPYVWNEISEFDNNQKEPTCTLHAHMAMHHWL